MPPSPPSWFVLLAFTGITVVSTLMLLWNIHRSTVRREWLELKEWARTNRLDVRRGPEVEIPDPVRQLLPPGAVPLLILCEKPPSIVTVDNVAPAEPPRALVRARTPDGRHWHVLTLKLDYADWPRTALRPVRGPHALVDRVGLRAYPALSTTERFVTHGTALRPAKLLADSHARALLPPDLALILDGPYLLLDFSTRPFDLLEFSRLLGLATQLRLHLPLPLSPTPHS